MTLTKIFRQAGESDIVVNAHKINAGEPVTIDNKSRDFFFLKRQDANTIISVVITLIQKKLPRYVQADPNEIQVMTPTRKGLLGRTIECDSTAISESFRFSKKRRKKLMVDCSVKVTK